MTNIDQYYGEALREMETGYRRDDLWGKAFATSKGDVQKAKSIYLEQLARLLATQAGVRPKVEPGAASLAMAATVGNAAVSTMVKLVLFLRYWIIRIIPSALLAYGLVIGIETIEQKQLINAAVQAVLANPYHPFLEPEVAYVNGRIIPLPELASDFENGQISELMAKYGTTQYFRLSAKIEAASAQLRYARSYSYSETTKLTAFWAILITLLIGFRLIDPRIPVDKTAAP